MSVMLNFIQHPLPQRLNLALREGILTFVRMTRGEKPQQERAAHRTALLRVYQRRTGSESAVSLVADKAHLLDLRPLRDRKNLIDDRAPSHCQLVHGKRIAGPSLTPCARID